MSPRAYYNEIDPYAAQWLRNLMAAGHIAPGAVDTRSIVDLRPADVAGYAQFHTFAGIAGWSLALRLAGVPDDFPVWTGSCPCQPFSAAGRRGGFSDERHLWPAWFELIAACRPALVFGEQVASKDGLGWLDAVFADLEGAGYACGAADLCAAGVGAPHIRQRLWFVAYAAEARQRDAEDARADCGAPGAMQSRGEGQPRVRQSERGGAASRLADANGRYSSEERQQRGGQYGQQSANRLARSLGNSGGPGLPLCECQELRGARRGKEGPAAQQPSRPFWTDTDWISCRDGKARPVEPGSFPLAHGLPGRVGKLRAYGNAIVPQVAAAFIGACLDALSPDPTPSPDPRALASACPETETEE